MSQEIIDQVIPILKHQQLVKQVFEIIKDRTMAIGLSDALGVEGANNYGPLTYMINGIMSRLDCSAEKKEIVVALRTIRYDTALFSQLKSNL